ncbi:hypothetical protein BGZ97_008109 [Linnemannia gamsii]|uniref:C2H2-type domain-containing protein n=1 Tax=Linnemannia gamsii TaxID=64522 RepID=A0A9P6QPZ1_9FUNG|nr:hypothetical protein BGZ97_008109 [Linnemannia gamsii]
MENTDASSTASSPHRGVSPTAKDIEAVAAVTAQAQAQAFPATISDATADILALTKALTTPIGHILPEDTATTVSEQVIAAVAAPLTSENNAAATAAVATESELFHTQDSESAAAVAAVTAALTPSSGQQPLHDQQTPENHHQQATAQEDHDQTPKPMDWTNADDVNSAYNQVLSINAQKERPLGKRTAQEAFEQDEAARALQLIALSLGAPSTSGANSGSSMDAATAAIAASISGTEHKETHVVTDAATAAQLQQGMEGVLKTQETAASVTDTLMSISRAINFPSESSSYSKIQDSTEAFTQAVINATQMEMNKNKELASLANSLDNSSGSKEGHMDTSALEKLSLHHENRAAAGDQSTSAAAAAGGAPAAAAGSNQGFTFEIDKVTGKALIKWTEPSDSTTEIQDADARAIQQALHTLIVNSGIGLSDLGVANAELLGAAPPLGQFPAQGSQFETAQDPAMPKAAPPAPRKKRRPATTSTAASEKNTAASIPEGAASFPCEFQGCNKVFARLYNLKSHSKTHTNERPFVCAHCELAFARGHDLKRHVKVHGGEKPFTCSGCSKSFSRLDALGRHRANSKNRAGCQSIKDAPPLPPVMIPETMVATAPSIPVSAPPSAPGSAPVSAPTSPPPPPPPA